MNEKQRWLMKDLEAWRRKQFDHIGTYGPKKPLREPLHVKAARKAAKAANEVLRKWEHDKKEPWRRQSEAITAKSDSVKRVIFFGKTEDALKAIRGLK